MLDTLKTIHDTLVIRDTVWAVDSTNRFLINDLNSFYSDNYSTLMNHTGIIIGVVGVVIPLITYWINNDKAKELESKLTTLLDKKAKEINSQLTNAELKFEVELEKALRSTESITKDFHDEFSRIIGMISYYEINRGSWLLAIQTAYTSLEHGEKGTIENLTIQLKYFKENIINCKFTNQEKPNVERVIINLYKLKNDSKHELHKASYQSIIDNITKSLQNIDSTIYTPQ